MTGKLGPCDSALCYIYLTPYIVDRQSGRKVDAGTLGLQQGLYQQ